MIILGIECSTVTASTAICEDGKLLGIFTQNLGNSHSETLLPMINDLLCRHSMTLENVDAFAVSAGPGSFTGIRIGTSMVKGLAFGKNKSCVGVSSLEALAYNFFETDTHVCAVINARRGNVYNALFRTYSDGKVERLCEDRLISAFELGKVIESKDCTDNFVLCGDGASLVKKNSENNLFRPIPLVSEYHSGYSVALCGLSMIKQNGTDGYTDSSLAPIYLRPTQAERELKGITE